MGTGEREVCPSETTTYRMRVVKGDDSVEVHEIPVQVRSEAPSGAGRRFSVDRMEIRPGECATFRWHVEGVKAVYFHREGRPWQDRGVVGVGEKEVCPKRTQTFCLRVVNRDDSLENHYITVRVGE